MVTIFKHPTIGLQGLLYGSRDFKKEIDVQGLTRYKEACENAMHKDNRGGHLGQEGVEAWTRDVYEDVMYTAAMDRMAAMVQKSMSEYIIDISYGIRIMFAHIREKRRIFRRWREHCPAAAVDHKLHPEWMLNLYNVIHEQRQLVFRGIVEYRLRCQGCFAVCSSVDTFRPRARRVLRVRGMQPFITLLSRTQRTQKSFN